MEDYYQILDVHPNASREEIRKRYRFLVLAYHPDRFPTPTHKKYAEEKLKKINEAYRILSDSGKRADYDKRRSSSGPRDEEERRRREEAEAARRRAEVEAEAMRRRAEEEQRKREEAEAAWQRAEAEAEAIRQRAEEERRKRGEAEAAQRHAEEEAEAARRRAAEEQRKREEAEAARRRAEEKSRRIFLTLVLLFLVILFYGVTTLPHHTYLEYRETEQSSTPADEKSLAKDLVAKGNWLYSAKDYAGALPYFQEVVKKDPYDATTWFLVGRCSGEIGHQQEAVEAYKQVIRLKPDDSLAHNNLGLMYTELKRYQDALEAFNQAIRFKPDYAEAYEGLGAVYYRQRRFQAAIKAYEQAVHLKPNDADLHYGLGWTYVRMDDKAAALKQYEILQALDQEKATQLYRLISPRVNVQPQTRETKEAAPGADMQVRSEETGALKTPAPLNLPSSYFTVGSTKDQVLAVQGTPDSFTQSEFRYGFSYVYFQSGRVVGWSNGLPKLRVQMQPGQQG